MEPVNKLRDEIEELERALNVKRGRLAQIERGCAHQWGPVETAHIHHKGYHIHGDAPGTRGVDRRLPMDVPPRTDFRWKRTCRSCGKVEITTHTAQKTETIPVFG